MDFPKSRAAVSSFEFIPITGSTNRDLLDRADDASLEDFSVLATDFQSMGRGRLDRSWEAAPQSSIMASVLLRPNFPNSEGLSWLTMAVALAIKKVTDTLLPAGKEALIKWPNDVLVDDLKLSGILAELSNDQQTVVVGFGLNVNQDSTELSFPSATSLRALGARSLDRDEILAEILNELRVLYLELLTHGGDASASGLRDQLRTSSATLGNQVEAQLPSGSIVNGLAKDLDRFGRLVIAVGSNELALSAGDIQHLRKR